MVLLNEAQLALYTSNMEQHITSIVGNFGHYQEPPYHKGTQIPTEVEVIKKRNSRGKRSRSVAEDLASHDFVNSMVIDPPHKEEDSLLFNIKSLHEANLKKVYIDNIDDACIDIDFLPDYLYECAADNMHLPKSYTYESHLLDWLMNYLKENFPHFFKFPKRPDLSKDWMYTPKELLEADKNHVKRVFSEKIDLKYHIAVIRMTTPFGNTAYGDENPKNLIYAFEMIFKELEEHFLFALERKAKKEEMVDNEYKALLEQFISKRKQQLSDLGFSEELVSDLIKREHSFFDIRAKLKTKPLPECYLLDQFDDDQCFEFFKFDKIMLKYLAAVLDIPRCNVYRTEKPQINAENKAVTIGTYEDPTAALAICLASLNNSASLHAMSHILGITPKMMSDISYNVVSYIAESFSHLLNTDNCTYNNSYLQLLVDKSSRPMHGMKQFTTHMIDGTYTRITKPIRRINSRFDTVWDLERQCETVRLQFVSDCLGMFTDVSSAACGTNTDRSLFTSSGVAKRLSKLKYKDTNFYVVGDSAYVSGTLPENEETKFFDCDDENGWNIYGAPLKNGSPKSQNKISMLKSFIERAFEFRNDLFEPMGKEDTQRRSLTRLSKENMAISVLTNLHQILYKSTWSQLISDVLPVDFYLLMWGALSDKKPLPVDL